MTENEDERAQERAEFLSALRQRRARALAATIIAYVAVAIIVGATVLAYPRLFSDTRMIEYFVRENYQSIVLVVAIGAGLLTAFIVAPRTSLEIGTRFLPSFGLFQIGSAIIDRVTGSKFDTELEDTVRRFEYSLAEAVTDQVHPVITEDSIFIGFLSRLEKEQGRLRQNALANLIWGVAFSVVGLAVLGYPILVPSSSLATDWVSFAVGYAPRGALGLLIALIAFFFLRLYAANENDLRHNKNEVSTFESKMIAVKMVSGPSKNTLVKDISLVMAGNERNFILKKGERTTGAELDRNFNDIREILKDLMKVSKSAGSRSEG